MNQLEKDTLKYIEENAGKCIRLKDPDISVEEELRIKELCIEMYKRAVQLRKEKDLNNKK